LAAKPKENVFDASPDRVYAAVQKVIRDHYIITFIDDKAVSINNIYNYALMPGWIV
jgi:hypothetical protein